MGDDPTGVILGGVVVIAGSTIVRMVKEGRWKGNSGRVIVFGFLLAAGLLLVGSFAPTIAKLLTAMGVVGALAINGPALFGVVNTLGKMQPEIRRPAGT